MGCQILLNDKYFVCDTTIENIWSSYLTTFYRRQEMDTKMVHFFKKNNMESFSMNVQNTRLDMLACPCFAFCALVHY